MTARPTVSFEMRSRQRGFGYLLLLFAIAALGVTLAGLGQSWSLSRQRQREAELIGIAREFSQAFASYARSTPNGQPKLPATLDDLLADPRFPFPVRHLRQRYRDPMTGEADWVPVMQQGRILAVHSASGKTALRKTPPDYITLPAGLNETRYSDWLIGLPQSAPLGQ